MRHHILRANLYFNQHFENLEIETSWVVDAPKEHVMYKSLDFNKKLKNKHIKQVVTLTVGVYLLFIVACGLCHSLEGFDNQEKSIEYYCGKCRTEHQQAHDEFIPHRNLVKPKPINEKEA